MLKQIDAALKAARAYKPRNEGDRSESELVLGLLEDCAAHARHLDALADAYEKRENVRVAEDALRAAQAG
jgi:hypothetical protein